MDTADMPVVDARLALSRLREGNRRFAAGGSNAQELASGERLAMAKNQHPFAIILGCSDSRVPAEIIFNQGLGDLFVIRVAGNIVAPSQIGSVEFAAATFSTQLVVVLGHSNCGVIQASIDSLRSEPGLESRSLSSIVDRVTPAISPLMNAYPDDDHALVAAATRTNVLASVEQLRGGSDILCGLMDAGKLMIVGAHYSLQTGEVDFFGEAALCCPDVKVSKSETAPAKQ